MTLALTRGFLPVRLPYLRSFGRLIARSDLSEAAPRMRLIDIGANLLDAMYQGEYNDKHYHAPDLEAVLERSWRAGVSPGRVLGPLPVLPGAHGSCAHYRLICMTRVCMVFTHTPHIIIIARHASGIQKIIITAGSLSESRAALELAKKDGVYSDCLPFTMCIHVRLS